MLIEEVHEKLVGNNQKVVDDANPQFQLASAVEPSASLTAIERVVRFHESEIGFNNEGTLGDTIDMRLLRVLNNYWCASNKRSRSMVAKKLIKIIFWLAHPHKDDKEEDSSGIDLLTYDTDRVCILAIRMLILLLVRLCGEDFNFAPEYSLRHFARAVGRVGLRSTR